jgi:Ser/Thr protein kinase RdoA (MazF antagonist)
MSAHYALSLFPLDGGPILLEPYGNGHIHRTWLMRTDAGEAYIVQQLNESVFHDIPALMENLSAITRYLTSLDTDPRHTLTLIPAKDGKSFARDPEGGCWRVFRFIPGSVCLESAESPRVFSNIGAAFGHFQSMLTAFPAHTLVETIPRFHDTPYRFSQLKEAIAKDEAGRLSRVREELSFAFAREKEADALVKGLRDGKLPLRVTHNDTKINNVLLDENTLEPLCVIDLDTVMPGLAAYDFGDAIRSGASTAAEDETDLDKVTLSMPYCEAFAGGFLGACGSALTDEEINTLFVGAKLMTLECGVRFLTDYLSGDVYFRTSRPAHNLDRSRTQFRLVSQIEDHWKALTQIIQRAMP